MDQYIGQHINGYRLTQRLGAGGFGVVYLGEHTRDHTQAAIKLLRIPSAGEEDVKEFFKQFINEASNTFRLKHPHIVPLLDFGIKEETPFLIMEYAPHKSLRERHPRQTQVPLTTIVAYVKQVASALQYAHENRLVHRDVKPENILVGKNNELLLTDFGIAVPAHSSSSWEVQKAIGSWPYAAPEHFIAKAIPASDQYSLAVVVYEWLGGSCPFSADPNSRQEIRFFQLAQQHMNVPPPPLRGRVPTISPEVEQVVMKGLAKKPEERHPSVTAFAEALEQAVLSHQAAIPPSPIPVNPISAPVRVSPLPQTGKADIEKQSIHQPSDQAPTKSRKPDREVQIPHSQRSQEVHDEQETEYRQKEVEYDEVLERYNQDAQFRQVYSRVNVDAATKTLVVDITSDKIDYYQRRADEKGRSTLFRNPVAQLDVFALSLVWHSLLDITTDGSTTTYREQIRALQARIKSLKPPMLQEEKDQAIQQLIRLKEQFLSDIIYTLEHVYRPHYSSPQRRLIEMKKVLQERVLQKSIDEVVKQYEEHQRDEYGITKGKKFIRLSQEEFNELSEKGKREYNRLSKIVDRGEEMRALFADMYGKSELLYMALLGARLMMARLQRWSPALIPVRPSPSSQNVPLAAPKAGPMPQPAAPRQSDQPDNVGRQPRQPSIYKSVQPPDQKSRTAHGNDEGRNDPRYKAILDQIRADQIVSNPEQIARDVLKTMGRYEINASNRINYSQRNKPKSEQHKGIPNEVQAPVLAAQLVVNKLGEVRVPEYISYEGKQKKHIPGSTPDVVEQVLQEQAIQADNLSYNALLAKLKECMYRKDISDIERVSIQRAHIHTRRDLYHYVEEALKERDNIRLGIALKRTHYALMPVESCVLEMAKVLNDREVFGPRQINALVDTYFVNLNPYPEGSKAPRRKGKNREWTQETWEQIQQENRDILAARLAVIKQSYASGHFMYLALIGLDRIKQTTLEPIRPYMVLPK